jgi:hypothetical protein
MNTMIPIQHRLSIRSSPIDLALHQFECDFRCHIPAKVVENQDGNAFNPQKMTVSVQPTIQEVIRQGAVPTITTLPILDDVPIKIPTAGGWSLTLPIKIGDECELSFQDMAFDLWWQNGGVQKQPDGVLFRHDIGDAFAEFGVRSVPNVIPNYSATSAQLRNDSGLVVIDLAAAGITITSPSLNIMDLLYIPFVGTPNFKSPIGTGVYSAALKPIPDAVLSGVGARAFVTDARANTFQAPYVGGGSYPVPVYSDGTGWFVG